MSRIAVVGATGDVGRGVVVSAVDRGWDVVVIGRHQGRLDALVEMHGGSIAAIRCDVSDPGEAQSALAEVGPGLDALVLTTSSPWEPAAASSTSYGQMAEFFDAYLRSHVECSTRAVAVMPAGSAILAIGGGMADAVVPGMFGVSMVQASQRMYYRHLAREASTKDIYVRELMLCSMVAGESNRETADASWLTDREIGERVCQIAADPRSVDVIERMMPTPRAT